jgi:hypothetical protein
MKELKLIPRSMWNGLIFLTVIIMAGNILAQSNVTWQMFKMVLILLPVFIASTVLSRDIESGCDAFVFTSRTAKYKLFLKRFFLLWLAIELLITLMYLSAIIAGLEHNLSGLLILIIYSTFLGLLGASSANLSGNSMIAYSVPLAYWMAFFALGYNINEKFSLISLINIYVTEYLFWNNLIFLAFLSILMLIFNLWYLSKGEHFRKKLLALTSMLFIVVILLSGSVYYLGTYKPYQNQVDILSGRQSSALIVLDSKERFVPEALAGMDIKYFSDIESRDLVGRDVIRIAERPITSPFFENEWLEGPLELKNIEDEYISILNAKALKVVTENPFDEDHYLIYMQSPDWNDELWNTVLSHDGEFVLIDEKDWLLRGDAKLRANPDKFLLIKKNNVTVYALDILPSYAFDSAIFASFMAENIRLEFGMDIGHVDVLVCHSSRNEYYSLIEQRDYSWKLKVGKLTAYNDITEGGLDWAQYIGMVALADVFDNIEDQTMRGAWSNYYFETVFVPLLKEDMADHPWVNQEDFMMIHDLEWYFSRVNQSLELKEFGYADEGSIAEGIVHHFQTENASAMKNVINAIYESEETLSNDDIKDMLKIHFNSTEVDTLFGQYSEAKNVTDSTSILRRVSAEGEGGV